MTRIELTNQNTFLEHHKFPNNDTTEGTNDIHLASIFRGEPANAQHLTIDYSIILDSNVCSDISQNKNSANIQALRNFATDKNSILDPSFALMEQSIQHGNPEAKLDELVASLNQNFEQSISKLDANKMKSFNKENHPKLKPNFELFRDYLPLVKFIWNENSKFEDKRGSCKTQHLSGINCQLKSKKQLGVGCHCWQD